MAIHHIIITTQKYLIDGESQRADEKQCVA